MDAPSQLQAAKRLREADDRPVLLFFSNRRSGPARRMSSLVAWVGVTEKKRLRVVEVDAERHADLAQARVALASDAAAARTQLEQDAQQLGEQLADRLAGRTR